MKPILTLAAMAALWPVVGVRAQTTAPLTVCMQQNDPPLSLRAGNRPAGFDLVLSDIVARRLGRELRIQWFVSRDDPDTSLPKDADALLSDGRCQLVAEYPLTEGTLAPPRSPVARLPPFAGAKPEDRTRWIKIGDLAATRPYRMETLAVVLPAREADRQVKTLGDLAGMKIGVQIATLSDAIAMRYADGRLDDQVVHFPDSRILFEKLQNGSVDAAFADLRAFDAWRLRHGPDGLVLSGYRHSIGFNMGYVGLATNKALIDQVDAVLADLQAHDAVAPLAEAAGVTFVPPRPPDVQPDVRPSALNGD
ncbi:MAG TPA: transporter substrate-binding domain-containing protein [Rhodopila sp.]|nr:transporter substrate-binding domain-containing protein [Rhodopila sp.]